MLLLLVLLGVGLSTALVTEIFDGSDGSDSAESDDDGMEDIPVREFGDGPQVVASVDYEEALIADAQTLVDEEEITQEQADAIIDAVVFIEGPLNVALNGGDDGVAGSPFDDTISGGDGDDIVQGRGGDDLVRLDAGLDAYGIDDRSASFPDDTRFFVSPDPGNTTEEDLEGGDDTIFGGAGDDDIADGFGSDLIVGDSGDDFLVAVDQDAGAPDTIDGGTGSDAIFADEGDLVRTGDDTDPDIVSIDLSAGFETGYDVVTVTEFDAARDTIELEGDSADLDANPDDPVSVEEDGDDTLVLVDGVPVLRIVDVVGLARADIQLSTV